MFILLYFRLLFNSKTDNHYPWNDTRSSSTLGMSESYRSVFESIQKQPYSQSIIISHNED